jgi:hypothetical protein
MLDFVAIVDYDGQSRFAGLENCVSRSEEVVCQGVFPLMHFQDP